MILKVTTEIDLDWVDGDEDGGFSISESIKSDIIRKISDQISEKITEKELKNVKKTIVAKINEGVTERIDSFWEKPVVVTDEWGDERDSWPSVRDKIKEAFDKFLTEYVHVDEKGNFQKESGYRTKRVNRMDYLFNKYATEVLEEKLQNMSKEIEGKVDAGIQNMSDGISDKLKGAFEGELGKRFSNLVDLDGMLQIGNGDKKP